MQHTFLAAAMFPLLGLIVAITQLRESKHISGSGAITRDILEEIVRTDVQVGDSLSR